MSYFPPYDHSKNKIEIELELSNYAAKADIICKKMNGLTKRLIN